MDCDAGCFLRRLSPRPCPFSAKRPPGWIFCRQQKTLNPFPPSRSFSTRKAFPNCVHASNWSTQSGSRSRSWRSFPDFHDSSFSRRVNSVAGNSTPSTSNSVDTFQPSENPTEDNSDRYSDGNDPNLAQSTTEQVSDDSASQVVTTGIVEVTKGPSVWDVPAEKFDFGVSAAQGPRDTMEDEAAVFSRGKCGFLYTMVLDGHDGLESVQWLAEKMFDIFSSVIDEELYSGACDLGASSDPDTGLCCPINLSPALTESFLEADKELLDHLKEVGGLRAARSGATATVALVKKDRMIVANVGDSRLVLCRGAKPVNLTIEHRVYGQGAAVDAEVERIHSVGGWIDDGRVCGILAVSRAFGDWELKDEGLQHFLAEGTSKGYWSEDFARAVEFTGSPVVATPDVTELRLQEDDEFVIIATDGVWDVMSSADAVRFVQRQLKKGLNAQEISDGLCDLALKRYTPDNVAVVVVDLVGQDARQERSAALNNSKKKKRGWFS